MRTVLYSIYGILWEFTEWEIADLPNVQSYNGVYVFQRKHRDVFDAFFKVKPLYPLQPQEGHVSVCHLTESFISLSSIKFNFCIDLKLTMKYTAFFYLLCFHKRSVCIRR